MKIEYGFSEANIFDVKAVNYLKDVQKCYLICDYCKWEFVLDKYTLRKRLVGRTTTNDSTICNEKKECIEYRKDQARRNKQNLEIFKEIGNRRRGKTVEELYGIETWERVRRLAKDNYVNYRKWCRHTQESKEKMSNARKKYIKENPNILKEHWIFMSELSKKPSRKIQLQEAWLRAAAKIKKRNSCSTGYVKYWYSDEKAYFESSYEHALFLELNDKKYFWKKNTKLYVPYIIDGYEKRTLPDVLVYKDKKLTTLKKLIEVKPYGFVFPKKKTRYSIITKSKILWLHKFCRERNLLLLIYTELDIPEKFIWIIQKYALDRNKKNIKNDLKKRRNILRDSAK